MRLLYFGTASFAVPALNAMAPHLALVVSQPDRPTGRGMRRHASPVKLAAQSLGLPVETPEKCRAPEFVARLREVGADALLVAAYGQILSKAMLDAAAFGGVNLHGSILPRYRGPAPIQRAILEGETETGVTLMQMDEGMDTGDLIAVARTAIGPDETAGELSPRLAELAAQLAAEWMPRIVAGNTRRTPQVPGLATYAPKVEKHEARLDPTRPASEEYARFRAFTPAPGAFFELSEGPLKVLEARPAEASGAPGTLIATSPELVLAMAAGALQLRRVQPAGRKPMSGADWANGACLRVGARV